MYFPEQIWLGLKNNPADKPMRWGSPVLRNYSSVNYLKLEYSTIVVFCKKLFQNVPLFCTRSVQYIFTFFFLAFNHPPMPSWFLISINLINLSKWNILFYRLWNTGPRRVNRDSLCGDTCYAEMTRYCAPVGWKLCSWVNTDFWLDKIMWESRNTRELRHVLQNKFTLRRSNEQHVQIFPPTPPPPSPHSENKFSYG